VKRLVSTVEKLCETSRRNYLNPYSALEWPPALDAKWWFTTPEFISLYGTEIYEPLTEAEKRRLSFYEAVNFFSLNIHGEKALVEGLARRLYRLDSDVISSYLHHFLDEENKHMVYFGGFCTRYAGKVYPDKKMVFPRDFAPGEEDFLFFAKVLIFEEIVDVYNVRMAGDERLAPIARRINLLHHRDEARHLVFGRQLVQELFNCYAPTWPDETLRGVREYLRDYLVATWKEYYNPEVYRDAGLKDPLDIQDRAFLHPQCWEHRRRVSAGCVRYLLQSNIFEEEPCS